MVFPLRRIHFDLFLSALGFILGASAFMTFIPIYFNYEAGVLGLYSALVAMAAFMLHWAHYKNALFLRTNRWYDKIEVFGFCNFIIGTAFMVFYVFMMLHKNSMPVEIVVRLVWSFMVAKWGLLLYMASKRYSRMSEETINIISSIQNE